jgi:peptidyl-prolyl cis-trans isomerase SurA
MRMKQSFLAFGLAFLACLALPASAAPAQAAQASPAAPGDAGTPTPPTPPAPPRVQEVDRIVAVVGNEAIPYSAFAEALANARAQIKEHNVPPPPEAIFEKQVLDRLVLRHAQLQMAKSLGISVGDAMLDATMKRVAAQNNLTLPEFQAALAKDGIAWPSYRQSVREDIAIARLKEREVDNQIFISDAEINNFIAQQKKEDQSIYDISDILLRTPEGASPGTLADIFKKAQDIVRRARAGESFAKLAATYSDGPNALSGGSWGARPASRLPPPFVEALQNMSEGDVSDPIQSPNGFHILRLNQKKGGQIDGRVQQTHAEHILIKVDELTSAEDAKRRLEDLRNRIEHGESFAELARLYSQDASAAKGGDLGWLNPGDTVPEFERAMNALAVGQVSDVVQTPFGYHLIKVLGRRVEDMSAEKERIAARAAIHERKADEAYDDWLRQLHDQTYIDERLNDNDD